MFGSSAPDHVISSDEHASLPRPGQDRGRKRRQEDGSRVVECCHPWRSGEETNVFSLTVPDHAILSVERANLPRPG